MLRVLAIALGAALLSVGGGRLTGVTPAPSSMSLAAVTPSLSGARAASIADIPWSTQVYTAATGESVDVSVSTSYPAAEDIGRHWADFYAALPHGRELERLKAYVAPLGQVQAVCGRTAVGCYGDNQLLHVNEAALGFAPEEVARHEYGHHIARYRLNSPWPALDWGPKHWASAAGICSRVQSGTAYPGDEFLLYGFNPGEAFAEAYRVLIDTRLGQAQPSWPLVDSSFYPDQATLDAVEQDVTAPWTGPRTHVFHVRLNRAGVWQKTLSTPLDGTATARVTAPSDLDVRVALFSVKGRTALAVGRSSLPARTRVCGDRAIIVRIRAAGGRGRRIDVRVTVP